MSADAPVWPDEATVERAAEALAAEDGYADLNEAQRLATGGADTYRSQARAALSVLPDPIADTVLLAQVREIVDEAERGMDAAGLYSMDRIPAYLRIAALLAGGDR